MREIHIEHSDEGQRLDKFLHRYMKEATNGFIYKMLRKKNIKLNRMKASGGELLKEGDVITLFLSDETISKFGGDQEWSADRGIDTGIRPLQPDEIVYEDEDILIIDKPAGELSQRAKLEDVSINERMLKYLLDKGAWNLGDLFTPGICNRLDRNTSGLILAGKTLHGSKLLSELIRERRIRKFYIALVEGRLDSKELGSADQTVREGDDGWIYIDGYLSKDEEKNKVTIYSEDGENRSRILTGYRVMDKRYPGDEELTYLEVELITGKTHQIRAHLASVAHPLAGDKKYGSHMNRPYMLRAYRVIFPDDERLADALRGRELRIGEL